MHLIDTHAHIYMNPFCEDIDAVIARCHQYGIQYICMPNLDEYTVEKMLELEIRYPTLLKSMLGLHPCSVDSNFEQKLYHLESKLNSNIFVGIGEAGVDLYHDKTYLNEQIAAFAIQLEWAKKYNLPIIVHCRAAFQTVIQLIEKHQDGRLHGIFHCFSGQLQEAQKIISLQFAIGIGGMVTFKNTNLNTVLPFVDERAIVLETDSPYLAPHPYRGKRNEPAWIVQIAKKVAEIKKVSLEKIASITTNNAKCLFQIDK